MWILELACALAAAIWLIQRVEDDDVRRLLFYSLVVLLAALAVRATKLR